MSTPVSSFATLLSNIDVTDYMSQLRTIQSEITGISSSYDTLPKSGTALGDIFESDAFDDVNGAQDFDYLGYATVQQKNDVLQRLQFLRHTLIEQGVGEELPDVQLVDRCIKFVSRGFALTASLVEQLNKIHHEYA